MEKYFDEMCEATGYKAINRSLWAEIVKLNTKKSIVDFRKEKMKELCKVETYKECTELVLMLNWASWAHDSVSHNTLLGRTFAEEFYKAQNKLYSLTKDNKEISSYIFCTLD